MSALIARRAVAENGSWIMRIAPVDLGEYQRASKILETALQIDHNDKEVLDFLNQRFDGLPKATSIYRPPLYLQVKPI